MSNCPEGWIPTRKPISDDTFEVQKFGSVYCRRKKEDSEEQTVVLPDWLKTKGSCITKEFREKWLNVDSSNGVLYPKNKKDYQLTFNEDGTVIHISDISGTSEGTWSCVSGDLDLKLTKGNAAGLKYDAGDKVPNKGWIQENMLNNIIKKTLIEVKETKKDLLIESKIVKNRYKLIYESSKKKNHKVLFSNVLSEMIKLRELNFDKNILIKEEESFFNLLNGLFGGNGSDKRKLMNNLKNSFTDSAISKLLETLGVDEKSTVGDKFKNYLGSVDSVSDVPKFFTDCSFVTDILSKSVVESMIESFEKNNTNGKSVPEKTKKSLIDLIGDQNLKDKIKSSISDDVCSKLDGLKTKMMDKAKEMKTKALTN